MANTAGHVQVAPDGTGKDIDAQVLTSPETNQPTVYRQTITLGDPVSYNNVAGVSGEGYLLVDDRGNGQQQAIMKMQLAIQQAQSQSFGGAGFVPLEIPTFLGGF